MNTPSARLSNSLSEVVRAGAPPVTVIRLGGSLLPWPDLVPSLLDLAISPDLPRPLIVVGGGAAADEVRARQLELGLDDVTAHWLAISTMTQNARQLQDRDSRLQLVSERREADGVWKSGGVALLDTAAFLRQEERLLPAVADAPPELKPWEVRLPATWHVTSDSIAAWIAVRWPAEELWLLKSCDAPAATVFSLARGGYVDAAFPQILPSHLAWRWINLRQQRKKRS